jgi:hypothetical protein
MKKSMNALKVLTVLAAVVVLFGCNPAEKATDSASMLIIESVLGYTADGTAAAFLESDVEENDGVNPAYVQTDTAAITLRAELLNPDSLTGPSQYNDILLTAYNVTYLDTTGAPTGIADLTGSLSSILCEIGRSTTVSLPVVLNSAKLAAPLSGLVGSPNTLNVVAQIELIGQDLVNKEVRTVGNLTIIFADYLDVAPPSPAPIKK